jgi:hypothetical protein
MYFSAELKKSIVFIRMGILTDFYCLFNPGDWKTCGGDPPPPPDITNLVIEGITTITDNTKKQLYNVLDVATGDDVVSSTIDIGVSAGQRIVVNVTKSLGALVFGDGSILSGNEGFWFWEAENLGNAANKYWENVGLQLKIDLAEKYRDIYKNYDPRGGEGGCASKIPTFSEYAASLGIQGW